MNYRHQVVETSLLKGNPWNPNVVDSEGERKLDASVKRMGMFKPIIVRQKSPGELEIIGGQHRWESAKRLGIEQVPVVNLGELSEVEAKEIGLADNGRWGHDDSGLLAQVLADLDMEALTEFLPYSGSDLEAIVATSEIDVSDLDLDDDDIDLSPDGDTAPPTHTIMRFKVPVLDAEDIADRIKLCIAEQEFNGSDSLTNAGDALVYLMGENE